MHQFLKFIFGIKFYVFQKVPLSNIRSFSLYTQQLCHTGLQTACKLSANLYVLLYVQWKTPDDGHRNCPKHVEFYSKNKFEKLVHLVGFFYKDRLPSWRAEYKTLSMKRDRKRSTGPVSNCKVLFGHTSLERLELALARSSSNSKWGL